MTKVQTRPAWQEWMKGCTRVAGEKGEKVQRCQVYAFTSHECRLGAIVLHNAPLRKDTQLVHTKCIAHF